MNRRQFLAGLLASTAAPALPIDLRQVQVQSPMMTLDDYNRLILQPLLDHYDRLMLYGNPKYHFPGLLYEGINGEAKNYDR